MKVRCISILLLTAVLSSSLAQVSQVWLSFYDNPVQGEDVGNAIAIDSERNVYVAGYTRSGSYGTGDFLTIKYQPNGDSVWLRTYNGTGNGEDEAEAIAVDRSGNVYVTGFGIGDGTGSDFVTVKYNTNGIVQWVRTYNGPINYEDAAHALVIDTFANVYVTGQSWGMTTASDFLTIKYNTDGVEQWISRDTCRGIGPDYAYAISLNPSASRVFVTGTSIGNVTSFDFYTSCYSSNIGGIVWSQRYNGPATALDESHSIAADRLNNVYVTGFVNDGPSTTKDYATIKYGNSGIEEWVRFYDGTGSANDVAESAAVDAAGNVYITGDSWGDTTNNDFATIKYTAQGDVQWVRRYNGQDNANDAALAMTVDRFSNVYVTGIGGNLFIPKITTVKYSTEGVPGWFILSDISGRGNAIKADDGGSVYVTGNSGGLNPDCITLKYDQTTSVHSLIDHIPDRFILYQNYPNPFNPTTRVDYALPFPARVSLKVYNLLGQEVQTIADEIQEAGSKSLRFDAQKLNSGVYFYRLKAAALGKKNEIFRDVKKMIILK
jgi:hypothetical protein